MEKEGERAVFVQPLCSPLQTVAVPAMEKGRGWVGEAVGQAVADLGPDFYSLLPSSVMDPGQVTYPLCTLPSAWHIVGPEEVLSPSSPKELK